MRRQLRPLSVLLVAAVAAAVAHPSAEPRWWKGNTHTHTLWSDGNAAPELVTSWYRENGYDFLVLTDHNQVQAGERWFEVNDEKRLKRTHVDDLVNRFGEDGVELREKDGRREMRLLTHEELAARFDAPDEFLMIRGEEVTAHWTRPATEDAPKRDYPVHVNALNVEELVPPRGAGSVAELLEAAVTAIRAEGERAGRTVVAHLNHPNFGWGVTWEDLAAQSGLAFFEVYNGHRSTRNEGDAEHPSTERIWDLALTRRLASGGELVYGVATDDSHEYFGGATSRPGRGWIHVRAASLEPEALMQAMHAGDFYASTGVVLEDVRCDGEEYVVDLAPREGENLGVQFIGARQGGGAAVVLQVTNADPAVYRFSGDELYVRAVVTSDRLHPDPNVEGELERAWTQPHTP